MSKAERILTSVVVEKKADGNYTYYDSGFLRGHEFLRRELSRAEIALVHLDVLAHPWKIAMLHEWMLDFFIPVMKMHHTIEDDAIVPYYLSLGLVLPDRHTEDHVTLEGRLTKLKSLMTKIKEVDTNKAADKNLLVALVDRLKRDFQDLSQELREHFNEEEIFWPPILKKYGEKNWNRCEALIMSTGLAHGEMNAGDSFRMTACGVITAMGVAINNIVLDPNDGGWCSEEMQKSFVMHAKANPKPWFNRYVQFRHLIQTVAGDSPTLHKLQRNKQGRFVSKIPLKPIPLILFIVLSLYFCLVVTPFLGAARDPLRNTHYLDIIIADFDGSTVGAAFLGWANYVKDNFVDIPNFRILTDSSDTSPETLKDRVLHGHAWATVYATSGATDRLNAALAGNCTGAVTSGYNAADAIYIVWDEARNSAVSNGKIDGFLRAVLPTFSAKFSANLMSLLPSSEVTQCISNGEATLLATPVTYTDENLTPTKYVPLGFNAMTVGSILVGVFNAMVFVNAVYKGTAALTEDMSPWGRTVFKAACLSLLGFGMSICYATIVVGLTHTGDYRHILSGKQWAQLFAVQWLHSMIWSFGHAIVAEAVAIEVIPFFFAFFLLSSIIGGWNTGLSDMGYKQFYQIFPFSWSMNIQKYVLYGTLKYRLRISAGILIAYFFVTAFLYFYFALKNEYKRVADKTAIPLEGEIEEYGDSIKKKHESGSASPASTGGVELVTTSKYAEVPAQEV